MSAPFLATITLLGGGGGAQPKSAGTHLAMITPIGGGHVDAGLPEGGFGGAIDPGWGAGRPPHLDHGLPGGGFDPGHPDAGLPPGGTPVPPTMWPPGGAVPPLPPNLANQVIVAVHRPGVTEWTVKAYPVPEPKA